MYTTVKEKLGSNCCVPSQILVDKRSFALHNTVTSQVPVLRRLVAVKVHEQEASEICVILDRLLT